MCAGGQRGLLGDESKGQAVSLEDWGGETRCLGGEGKGEALRAKRMADS